MAPKEIENDDDDLKLFIEMRSHDKENSLLAPHDSEDFNDKSAASSEDSSGKPRTAIGDVTADDFLNSEAAKTDYDWLISPPETPLFPSLDMDFVTKSESTEIRILNPKAALSNGSSSYNAGEKRRPSSSSSSRPATPTTGRATFPAIIKSSSRPNMGRSSTPTTTKSKVPISTIKPSSRSTTPAAPQRRSSAPSSLPIRGISPSVKSRPLKTSDVSNSKPLLTQRASSAGPRSRGGRVLIGTKAITRDSIFVKSRAQMDDDNDEVNPVLMGTMMVERVVNMRKLAPPRQDDDHKQSYSSSSSVASSGFGRSLSKKSLDMAMRHMDIRRSIPGSLRLIKTNNGQNSSIQSTSSSDSSSKSREESFSDSSLGTSSSSSCEPASSTKYRFEGRNEQNQLSCE